MHFFTCKKIGTTILSIQKFQNAYFYPIHSPVTNLSGSKISATEANPSIVSLSSSENEDLVKLGNNNNLDAQPFDRKGAVSRGSIKVS